MKKIRLGDIATLITKGTTPTTIGFSFVDTGVNFVKIESIGENGEFLPDKFARITDECDKKLRRSQLEENDILFSIAGAIGRTAIVPSSILPANTNQALAIIRIPQNAINLRFVLYALQSQAVEEQSEKQKQGVAQLNLSLKNIADILIPLVSSEKQDEIVRNLAAIDAAIALRKEQIRLIDQLVKSRFVEMFEKGEFERIPFDSFCEFLRNGASIKQTKGAGGYPITRIETLANDTFNIDRLGYANITELKGVEKYILQKGDILISHINSVAYLGRAVQYRGESNTPIIHGMNLLCARLRNDCNSTYVEYFFKTPMAKDYISTITKKAVNQASITTTDLKKMPIPDPPAGAPEPLLRLCRRSRQIKISYTKIAVDKPKIVDAGPD